MRKFLIVLLILVSEVFSETLTLKECIRKALSSHPNIKSFILKEMLAKENHKSEKSLKYPQIQLHAKYDASRTFILHKLNGFDTQNDSAWEIGATLKQNIWDFSQKENKIKASEISRQIAKLSLKDAKNLIAFKVKTLYLQLIFDKKSIEVRKTDLKAKKSFYEQAKALKKEGLKTDADVFRFSAALYKARSLLDKSENEFLKTKKELELYINEKIPKSVSLEDKILEQKENMQLKDLKKLLLNENLSLKEVEKETQKNIYEYKSAKAQKYGSFDLTASYSRNEALFNYDSSAVGIYYSLPLFTGGKLKAQEEKAKISRMISKEKLESLKLELLNELNSLFLDLKSLNSTIKASLMEIKALKKTKKIIFARYKAGLATYMEVLDSQALLSEGYLSLLKAKYEKSVIISKIKYLTGQENE